MEHSQAQRRLVKSPPELWAELSSEDALGRHLAEFGEIRITRVEPETTVAWEGDRASGTVQISPTGWGTQVTLTAEPVAVAEPEPVASEPVVVAEAEPVASEPVVVAEAEPEPIEPAAAAAPTPVARISLRESEPPEQPITEHGPAPRGFFARFFRRPVAPAGLPAQPLAAKLPVPTAAIPGPPAPMPDPSPPTPGPDPMPPVPDPSPAPQPGPDPVPPDPSPPGPGPGPGPTIQSPLDRPSPAAAEHDPEPAPSALDPERTVAILSEVLDDLGAAHHRPFSRG